jgi:hypothetical protein
MSTDKENLEDDGLHYGMIDDEETSPFYQRGVYRASTDNFILEKADNSAAEIANNEAKEVEEHREEVTTDLLRVLYDKKEYCRILLAQGRAAMAMDDYDTAAEKFFEASVEDNIEGVFYLGCLRVHEEIRKQNFDSRYVFIELRRIADALHKDLKSQDPQLILKLMELLDKLHEKGLIEDMRFEKEFNLENLLMALSFCKNNSSITSAKAFTYLRGVLKKFIEGKFFQLYQDIYNKKNDYEGKGKSV